jgi:hypothetical protein
LDLETEMDMEMEIYIVMEMEMEIETEMNMEMQIDMDKDMNTDTNIYVHGHGYRLWIHGYTFNKKYIFLNLFLFSTCTSSRITCNIFSRNFAEFHRILHVEFRGIPRNSLKSKKLTEFRKNFDFHGITKIHYVNRTP